jgi:hypothetical protein
MQIILYMELYVSTSYCYFLFDIAKEYKDNLREYLFGFNSLILLLQSIQYIILESDNLSSLFPDASLNLGGFKLNVHILFAGSNCMYLDWRMRLCKPQSLIIIILIW